jgi:hypothetical protein
MCYIDGQKNKYSVFTRQVEVPVLRPERGFFPPQIRGERLLNL